MRYTVLVARATDDVRRPEIEARTIDAADTGAAFDGAASRNTGTGLIVGAVAGTVAVEPPARRWLGGPAGQWTVLGYRVHDGAAIGMVAGPARSSAAAAAGVRARYGRGVVAAVVPGAHTVFPPPQIDSGRWWSRPDRPPTVRPVCTMPAVTDDRTAELLRAMVQDADALNLATRFPCQGADYLGQAADDDAAAIADLWAAVTDRVAGPWAGSARPEVALLGASPVSIEISAGGFAAARPAATVAAQVQVGGIAGAAATLPLLAELMDEVTGAPWDIAAARTIRSQPSAHDWAAAAFSDPLFGASQEPGDTLWPGEVGRAR